jgi:type II secretory pathway pseudopilin PulG
MFRRFAITRCRAFTYVELLIVVAISGLIMLALMGVVNTATETSDLVRQRNDLAQQARFALNRMVDMTSRSPRLLLPLIDNPGTNWPENLREQTIPASPPIGDSTLSTAVLAITLPHDIDLDQDGTPDADNDADGRFDEDPQVDNHNDNAPGIAGIDDNGDGTADDSIDVKPNADNDEDDSATEDSIDGIDNDNDGSVDEDLRSDLNNDGQAGFAGVDDDGDGSIDEGNLNDDDEDGLVDEDSFDAVVFYLVGGSLTERMPVPWDQNADSVSSGEDYVESELAINVTRFGVERVDHHNIRDIVDLTLELTDPDSGETVSLQTRVRVGGAL